MTQPEKEYRVWVIEDDRVIRMFMERLAARHGFVILKWFETFPEAFKALATFDASTEAKPDAVLIDGNLKFLREIDQDGKLLAQKAKQVGLLSIAFTYSEIGADINPGDKQDWKVISALLDDYYAGAT